MVRWMHAVLDVAPTNANIDALEVRCVVEIDADADEPVPGAERGDAGMRFAVALGGEEERGWFVEATSPGAATPVAQPDRGTNARGPSNA